MKKIFFILIVTFSMTTFIVSDVHVNGYTKEDGTYVEEHYRSSPNDTVTDNYSTYGNTNPYTGEEGTKRVYDYDNGEQAGTSYTFNDSTQDFPWYLHIIFILLGTFILIIIIDRIMTKLYDLFSEYHYDMSGTAMFVLLCFTSILYFAIIINIQ